MCDGIIVIIVLFFIKASLICVGGYVLTSLVIQILTWIDDGEGTLFKGRFCSISLSQLTAGGSNYDRRSKKLLLPWVIIDSRTSNPEVTSKGLLFYSWIIGLMIALAASSMLLIALALIPLIAIYISIHWEVILTIFGIFVVVSGIVMLLLLMRWAVRLYKKTRKGPDGAEVSQSREQAD